MVFRLARTFAAPTSPTGSMQGMPPIGAGAQQTGPASQHTATGHVRGGRPLVDWTPQRPTKGRRSWLMPSAPSDAQRGMAQPGDDNQKRPAGSMPNAPIPFGGVAYVKTWIPDFGAALFAPNFGKVLQNPIGAGIYAADRPRPSYGSSAIYENGAIWWVSQIIPTSVNLQGLTDPQELQQQFGNVIVQAMYPTTG